MVVEDVFNITPEEEKKGEILYQGLEYAAWYSFVWMNRHRKFYHSLSADKKIKKSHHFYDFVFRVTAEDGVKKTPRYIQKEVFIKDYSEIEKETNKGAANDHPFSARFAYRAIMDEHQYLLDNFEDFKIVFQWLSESLITVTKELNQDVKYKSDKDARGELLTHAVVNERYVKRDGTPLKFWDTEMREYVTGFPLTVMPFYSEYEKKKIEIYDSKKPANLSNFME
tara:strand:+ start:678 stop:1352 length:675 start_codon:yes stop_codon:yes gene_type:complete